MTENQELKAMGIVFEVLQGLDAAAQERVLNWVLGALNLSISGRSASKPSVGNPAEAGSESGLLSLDEFETASDLLSATSPKSDSERVLIVGAFLQAKHGKKELAGMEINSELKHMGHGVSNVTQAISSLMARKPQLMIQTRKGGKSQQARKSYKVTGEGMRFIAQMLAPQDA